MIPLHKIVHSYLINIYLVLVFTTVQVLCNANCDQLLLVLTLFINKVIFMNFTKTYHTDKNVISRAEPTNRAYREFISQSVCRLIKVCLLNFESSTLLFS